MVKENGWMHRLVLVGGMISGLSGEMVDQSGWKSADDRVMKMTD